MPLSVTQYVKAGRNGPKGNSTNYSSAFLGVRTISQHTIEYGFKHHVAQTSVP